MKLTNGLLKGGRISSALDVLGDVVNGASGKTIKVVDIVEENEPQRMEI